MSREKNALLQTPFFCFVGTFVKLCRRNKLLINFVEEILRKVLWGLFSEKAHHETSCPFQVFPFCEEKLQRKIGCHGDIYERLPLWFSFTLTVNPLLSRCVEITSLCHTFLTLHKSSFFFLRQSSKKKWLEKYQISVTSRKGLTDL